MSDRLVSPNAANEENATEHALRPKSLSEFVGQQRVRDQIGVLLQSAKRDRKSTRLNSSH